MKWLKRALPHLTVVLSLMTLTFFAIDRVNTGMAFMTSELSKWVFFLLAVCALVTAVLAIGAAWREDARQSRKRQRARERAALHRMGVDDPRADSADSADGDDDDTTADDEPD